MPHSKQGTLGGCQTWGMEHLPVRCTRMDTTITCSVQTAGQRHCGLESSAGCRWHREWGKRQHKSEPSCWKVQTSLSPDPQVTGLSSVPSACRLHLLQSTGTKPLCCLRLGWEFASKMTFPWDNASLSELIFSPGAKQMLCKKMEFLPKARIWRRL